MKDKLIVILKTVLMAGAAASVHALVQSMPQILPLIPPKWAPLVTLVVLAAGLYHKQPPSSAIAAPATNADFGGAAGKRNAGVVQLGLLAFIAAVFLFGFLLGAWTYLCWSGSAHVGPVPAVSSGGARQIPPIVASIDRVPPFWARHPGRAGTI